MKILSLYAKINSDGNLVDSVLNHGNQNINFLEMDRIFYLVSKMKMKHLYIDGRVLEISICMQMTDRSEWVVVRQREDLLFL